MGFNMSYVFSKEPSNTLGVDIIDLVCHVQLNSLWPGRFDNLSQYLMKSLLGQAAAATKLSCSLPQHLLHQLLTGTRLDDNFAENSYLMSKLRNYLLSPYAPYGNTRHPWVNLIITCKTDMKPVPCGCFGSVLIVTLLGIR